jgi:ElaB/YqjD/DUF883 family membrane-anchored ribosome-binding protein
MAADNNLSLSTQKVVDRLGQAATEVKDKARNLMDEARETASNISDKARDSAKGLKDRADEALSNAGRKMTSLAENLHEKAPQEGVLGTAANSVADNLRTGGRYLQEHHLDDMGRDITSLVREYPIQAAFIGFGLGCLLGMVIRRR